MSEDTTHTGRCGPAYGADCDSDGPHPCCSSQGWCGITAAHCNCSTCVDFRHKGKLNPKYIINYGYPYSFCNTNNSNFPFCNPVFGLKYNIILSIFRFNGKN